MAAKQPIKIRELQTAENPKTSDFLAVATGSPVATRKITIDNLVKLVTGDLNDIGARVVVGSVPPASPTNGDLWYDDVEAELYVYVSSLNGWIQTNGSGNYAQTGATGDCFMLDKPTVLHARWTLNFNYEYITSQVTTTSGTITRGVTSGIPGNATEVQLHAITNASNGPHGGFSVKQPGHTHWKRIINEKMSDGSYYPTTNTGWYALDSSGKLDWKLTTTGTSFELILLEIQGYRA